MIAEQGILYIEPSEKPRPCPLIDGLTRKMTAALRRGKPGPRYRGCHTCACGAESSNTDYTLPNGEKTNLLCIHYLAYHRDEIPSGQLAKVHALNYGEAVPTEAELAAPKNG